jgi:hypothetical protein
VQLVLDGVKENREVSKFVGVKIKQENRNSFKENWNKYLGSVRNGM